MTHSLIFTHRYQAIYNYKPQKDDELMLVKGSFYKVTDKCRDGWYRGYCMHTETSGVFPGNYVQQLVSAAETEVPLPPRTGRVEPPRPQAERPNKGQESAASQKVG